MSGTKGGDVEYLITADDSQIESDLERANKKIEKASKDSADKTVKIEKEKTEDIKKEIKKVESSAENSSDNVKTFWQKATDKIKNVFQGATEEVEDNQEDIGSLAENISNVVKNSFSEAAEAKCGIVGDSYWRSIDTSFGELFLQS